MTALLQQNLVYPDVEKRSNIRDIDSFWNILTLAQKLALNKLNQYGYQLAFTRSLDGTHIAVALCDGTVAMIDFEGEVVLNSDLTLRS